ncbi:MAG: phosphoglucosamine mutase [Alphaproteobacteria bacterium]
MSRNFFGTDGVRGRANVEPITAASTLRLAMAAASVFARPGGHNTVVIGKDTRLSGYMIESAMLAGFTAMGMDVVLTGPIPTPAIAMMTRSLRADLGVVISASHNQATDNGVKLFGPDGYKLADEIEAEIEARMANVDHHLPQAERLGRARRPGDAVGRYVEFAKGAFPRSLSLSGMRIVIDCAHGAGYKAAPAAFWELGAEVIPLSVQPNGNNINDGCGATHPEPLREAVLSHRADLGVALDGDADRVQLVDDRGAVIDGDQLLALIAESALDQDRLQGGGVVATQMSNLGLERHLAKRNLTLARTQVGDRYVVEHMRAHGFNVGGEQSGHIVLSDYSTTGDGLIAGLQAAAAIMVSGKTSSEVLNRFVPMPQILKNVRYEGALPLEMEGVQKAVIEAEKRLLDIGRLLIRKSGTEPLIRVMAEGEDAQLITNVVDELVDTISRTQSA